LGEFIRGKLNGHVYSPNLGEMFFEVGDRAFP
jgi:hypothetical protein